MFSNNSQASNGRRYLHTLQSLDNRLGGAIHAGLNVCKYLEEAGHDVQVVATVDPQDDLEYLKTVFQRVPYTAIPRIAPRRWYNGRGLSEWLGSNVSHFNLVELHAVFSFVTLRAAQACRKNRIPYLLRPHGSLDPFDLRKRKFLKRVLGPLLIRPTIASAAGVVCTADREAELLETYGANVRRFVVPLPVPSIQVDDNARSIFRRAHQIPEDAFVVLFLSRIDYKKGLDFLLPALAAAQKVHNDVWFVLAGGGESAFVKRIHDSMHEMCVSARIREVGFLSGKAKAAAIAAADLFALPSLNENFGMVIVESMQLGCPVLISDQVYIHKKIIESGAGFLCKPSIESCTEKMLTLLASRGQVFAARTRAAKLAASSFSPEHATEELLGVYDTVIGSRTTSGGK